MSRLTLLEFRRRAMSLGVPILDENWNGLGVSKADASWIPPTHNQFRVPIWDGNWTKIKVQARSFKDQMADQNWFEGRRQVQHGPKMAEDGAKTAQSNQNT